MGIKIDRYHKETKSDSEGLLPLFFVVMGFQTERFGHIWGKVRGCNCLFSTGRGRVSTPNKIAEANLLLVVFLIFTQIGNPFLESAVLPNGLLSDVSRKKQRLSKCEHFP